MGLMVFLFGKKKRDTSNAGTALRIQTSLQGVPIPIGWGQTALSGNLIWYGDFKATPHASQSGGKGGMGSGGKGGGGTTYTYQVSAAVAFAEGPVTSFDRLWVNKTVSDLTAQNLTAFLGTYAQSAWGYLTTNHPTQADNYRGLAYFAGTLALGDSQEIPNYVQEMTFARHGAISGKPDADPKDVIVDLLTNVSWGSNFPSALIDTLSVYSAYCRAFGLVVSPLLSTALTAASFIDDMMRATNSELVWSNGLLTIVPYGDQTKTANGATYTAPSAPIYVLTDVDFVDNQASNSESSSSSGGSDPIIATRIPASKRINSFKLEYLDRANQYDPAIVEAKDTAAITAYGPQSNSSTTAHMFCDVDAANMSAQLLLGRAAIGNTFAFTLPARFILLDPMDIVSIPDNKLGLVQSQWVRIKEITENGDRSLSMVAEEYLAGTGAAPLYASQIPSGYTPNYLVPPGSVIVPIIFAAPIQIAPTGLEEWMAISGVDTVNWGGAFVWLSYDGTTYKNVGSITGASAMGVLTSTLANHADPDTTNTLAVNLAQSAGVLTPGTTADADNFSTLLYVDGEFMSYRDATLTSAFHYDLGYLRRAAYGSGASAHLSGTVFARLDDRIFRLPYSKDQVGKVVYVKLASFNIHGGPTQDLSLCTPYMVTLGGPPTIYRPSSVAAFGSIKSIRINWVNAVNVGIDAVEIWRSPSAAFGSAVHINDVAANATTFTDENLVTGTSFWYWIRYRDRAGNVGGYSPSSAGAGVTAAATALDGAVDIQSGTIPALALAAGLNVPQVVATVAGYVGTPTAGKLLVLSANDPPFLKGQLLRYDGTAWTAAVPAVDIIGQVTNVQIADVAAVKISGTLTNSQIADLAAVKITGALLPSQLAGGVAQGYALNSDPVPVDAQAWTSPVSPLANTAAAGISVTNALGRNSLHMSVGGAGGLTAINAPYINLDGNKTYRLTGNYLSGVATNGNIYIGIAFFDNAGALISGTVQGYGTFFYYGVNGLTALNSSRSFDVQFGNNTSHPYPSGAVRMAPVVIGNYGNTVNPDFYAWDVRIEEVIRAGQILAGTITANEIAGNTITANKMLVASSPGGVLNFDPSMRDSTAWNVSAGAIAFTNNGGLWYAQAAPSSAMHEKRGTVVDPFKTYRIQATVWRDSGATGTLYLRWCEMDTAGTVGTVHDIGVANVPVTTGGVIYSGTFTTSGPRIVAPYVNLNWAGSTGLMYITDFRIEEIIPGELIVDGAIIAQKLAANSVTAAKILAGAITTEKLLVASAPGAVLNDDPNMADPTAWQITSGSGFFNESSAESYFKATPEAWVSAKRAVKVDVTKKYRLSAMVYNDFANGTLYLRYHQSDASNTFGTDTSIDYTVENVGVAPGGWWRIASLPFSPAVQYILVEAILNYAHTSGAGNNFYIKDFRLEEVIPGELIVDGAITANKIGAGEVTAGKLAANSVVAANIVGGTITANELASNSVTAVKIAAGNVIAGKLAAGAVQAGQVEANAITAGTVAAGAINATAIIVGNIIVTGHIQADNVTKVRAASAAGPVSAPAASAFTAAIVSVSDTFIGQPVLIAVSVDFSNIDSAEHLFGVRVRRNSTDIYSASARFIVPKNPNHFPFSLAIVDASPGGSIGSPASITYSVQMNGDSLNIRSNLATISTLECKT